MVYNEKELGEALKKDQDYIEIEVGSKAGKAVLRIKATGKVAWVACIGAIGVAVASLLATPAVPLAGGMSFVAAPAIVAVLGPNVSISAVAIAVAGGGAGSLNKLRKYKMEKRDGKIILIKKR